MAGRSTGDGAASWRQFEALLTKAELSPFYVLFGKERYFIREAVARLKERVVPSPDLRELLLHSVVASEVSGAELADLGRSEPFFSGTQLILVRDADKLRERELSVELVARLLALSTLELKRPVESLVELKRLLKATVRIYVAVLGA